MLFQPAEITPAFLSSLAGILLSLLISYLPGFADWFAQLAPINKRLVLVGLLLLSSIGTVALSCSGVGEAFGLPACQTNTIILTVQSFILAFITNQAAYVFTPDNTPAKARAQVKAYARRSAR